MQPPARFLNPEEQPEASDAECDYTVGPRLWKIGLLSANTPRATKGVSGLFCSSEWAHKLGRKEADVDIVH